MNKFLLIFLFSNLAFASDAQKKMDLAKEAAKTTKTVQKQKAVLKPEKMSDESLNALICPRVANQFTSASENALRAMHDLYDTLHESRDKASEFYLMLLELNKTNPEHEEAASKIVDIKNGIDQKLSRAKLNYNQEIKSLATHISRAKKCWSFHEADDKSHVGRFLEIYQKEPILEDFKKCVSILERNNRLYLSQFKLSVNYYNRALSKESLIKEAGKIDSELQSVAPYENKQCGEFKKGGVYAEYFAGKYDHKKITPTDENKIVDQKVTIPQDNNKPKPTAPPKWRSFFGFGN